MNQKLKILHLEDLPSDAELVERELKRSGIEFEKRVVDNRKDFEKALVDFSPDIILSDHSLPSFDSIGALKVLKEKKLNIPFILITATISEEFAVDVMKQGAADYILKDRLQRLPNSVLNTMDKWRTEEERQKQLKEITDYKYALDQSSIVAITDRKGIIKYANENFCKISKYTAGELVGQDHRIINSGYHSKEFIKDLWTTISQGKVWKGEIKNKAKDGSYYWVNTTIVPFLDDVGKPYKYLAIRIDVTEKKEAEDALRESEAQLKEAQAVAHLGHWELNFKTHEALWSEEACRIYGLSPAENKQGYAAWESYIHPEDYDEVMKTVNASEKSLSDSILNHRIILKDGTIKYIHSISKFKFDHHGKPVGLYGISHDVTERKIAEENLKQSESRLKEAQAIARISNWQIDMIQNTHTWSDELYKIYGIEKDSSQPSAELFMSFIHPGDKEFAQNKMNETFETLKSSSFNFRFIRKDGALRHGYTEWKFEFDRNDRPIRLYGILQDITERKSAEEEMEKMMADIVQRNKGLEQFSYIVSHNLRAPVANIIGYTNAFSSFEIREEEKKELLAGLSNSVNRLDDVIKDLNHILQVKREVSERKEIVHFSKLVDDIKASISNMIQKENAEIKTDFAAADEFFTLKGYLHSIFYNLISNSIKYRRVGVHLQIEIKSEMKNGKIILSFSDNGLGIDLSNKSKQVFGLYKRFHPEIEGKGMGLFMTKTQVETLGGRIAIESEVNKGTKITIEFTI